MRLTVAALALLAAPAAAQQGLYSDERLLRAAEQMRRNVELVVTEDIPAALPRDQRAGAADIAVTLVARAAHPLGFFSDPSARTVIVPVESLVFLDELAVLTAWFEARSCRAEYIQTYLWALLREGRLLPGPLEAFGVDYDGALQDDYVLDVSTKIFDTVVLYALAHEVGHLMLGHTAGLTGTASQAQEIEADAFALDHFAAVGLPPLGMAVYFLAARWLDPVEAAAQDGSHPVSPGRLRAIAERLAAAPDSFAGGYSDPDAGAKTTLKMAAELTKIANFSAGEEVLTVLPMGLSRDFAVSRLATACPS